MNLVALMLLASLQCPGTTTREVEACLASELAGADVRLNRYYGAAVARLRREGQKVALARLRASERAWIAYRDAECDAVWEYWRPGAIGGTFAARCRLTLTRERTAAIWRTWLTFADGTSPLLPEPWAPDRENGISRSR